MSGTLPNALVCRLDNIGANIETKVLIACIKVVGKESVAGPNVEDPFKARLTDSFSDMLMHRRRILAIEIGKPGMIVDCRRISAKMGELEGFLIGWLRRYQQLAYTVSM